MGIVVFCPIFNVWNVPSKFSMLSLKGLVAFAESLHMCNVHCV
jgi:hypothetical protein